MTQSALGLAALVAIAWLLSERKKSVSPRAIVVGIGLQLILGFLFLKIPVVKDAFLSLNTLVLALEAATTAGTSFVFGYLGGAPLPFAESSPGTSFIMAFKALPLVLVVSALSSLLFFWRILPAVVRFLSLLLQKSMGIGGALGVSVAANIFVGMVEAPLFIRPYLKDMTRSELFTVMTAGMATIAGTVMVLYATFLQRVIPDALGHILVASFLSAPAAILVSAIMIPETGPLTSGKIVPPNPANGSMDAIVRGATDGIGLLINIAGMLIVLVALVSLADQLLAFFPDVAGSPLSLPRIFGFAFRPLVWLIGIPWAESETAGMLMGTKTALNELLAYLDMSRLPQGALSDRSRLIMTYAMCGFANFGSLGILVGGMGTMAPERRDEIVALGLRSIVSGTLATLMTGAVVGIFL
ncbi:NupC/NupG family nucleoside CNT transporter [Desulfolutivibrio sulfoxidireducens]|uniref:NupC/NupG family nucleoside CNT transporter n=1 Tax=Desulfolutivibrio sulfoxidireducens TaxID=2773299 RepID=UPI00159E549E|nr:nucleoside transporter C-terminal domain-containing protein [Desulfolutivibrio sulfoxidireducens]QLA15927.1 nucleoside:proton symporter [Desulfolutivibrio sulfoxidireducens]QLA20173.1 nucleoside:proton symporter [Desulfolutivibrio sulfoxidireducens]